jgi:tRNA 2-thiouridine synthesizing protein A
MVFARPIVKTSEVKRLFCRYDMAIARVTMTNSNQSRITEIDSLEPTATLALFGAPWATLTTAIKARLQQLQPGQLLSVKLDDPLARVDVPAWCALTGNVLEATGAEEGGVIRFFIRKESKRR